MLTRAWWSLVLVAACSGGGDGGGASAQGDASIHVTSNEGADLQVAFADGKARIQVTPPSGRVFTVSLINDEPAFSLQVLVDGNVLREGDRVDFPLVSSVTNSDLRLTAVSGGRTFSSDRSGTEGTLTLEILTVDELNVDFRARFLVTLASDTATRLTLDGYLEAHQAPVDTGGGTGI
ncbi:MAG: hypothetical protein HY904_18430 [Deltaproteobacteria bacterium]|nr:hypothetical protein [Deltaproteobacteria bacterium]